MGLLSALLTVILLQWSMISCQLSPRFIDGSLSQPININITFYSRYLKGTVLYLVDCDINNLLINIERPSDNKTASVSIRYNEEIRTSEMLALCGCDPCDARMTNFHITSTIDSLNILCNNHGQQQVPRNHAINRENPRVIKSIQDTMDGVGTNTLYASINLKGIGCLKSFQYNGQPLIFSGNRTDFLSACPRTCTPDDCNGGQCSPLYLIGPLCDCSRTILGGTYCNNSMQEYYREANNTFENTPFENGLNLKLFWKPRSLNKKYCLLSFVHQYGHVTFSTHQTFLLTDSGILTNIYSDRINSLEVDITTAGVTIKVNNRNLPVRPDLFGRLTIRVGFTEKQEPCDTFEGKYYFVYNSSQLRLKASATVSKVLLTFLDKNKIIAIAGIVGLSLIVVLICMVGYRIKHQKHVRVPRKQKNGVDEESDANDYEEIGTQDP